MLSRARDVAARKMQLSASKLKAVTVINVKYKTRSVITGSV